MTVDVHNKFVVASGTELDFTNQDGFHMYDGPTAKLVNDGTVLITTDQGAIGVDAQFAGAATVINALGASFTLNMTGEIGDAIAFQLEADSNVFTNAGDVTVAAPLNGSAEGLVADTATVTNSGSFSVSSGFNAIGFDLTGASSFDNSGTIEVVGALQGEAEGVVLEGFGSSFHNGGDIHVSGSQYNIGVDWSFTTTQFQNDGSIVADQAKHGESVGLEFDLTPDPRAVFDFGNTGLIEGHYAILDSGGMTSHIDNSGRLVGIVDLGAGDDQLIDSGRIKGVVHMGDGNDLFDGSAGIQKSLVDGGAGDDTLVGGARHEQLLGGDGNDKLTGGLGNDQMTGGAGADTFFFLTLADSTVKNSDQITDLEAGDRINLAAIDADTTVKGNQAFHIVASLDGHAGELAMSYDAGFARTTVSLDVDGDGQADSVIFLAGDQTGFTNFAL